MNTLRSLLIFLISIASFSVKAQKISSWKVTKLQNYIAKSDSVLVINFWATFCKPCIEELPYFQTILKKYKDQKVKFIMVSMDLKEAYPNKIIAFARQNKYKNDFIWLDETNADYFCPKVDKAWMGGIPATLFVNPKTGYRKFFEQQIKAEDFEKELKFALNN